MSPIKLSDDKSTTKKPVDDSLTSLQWLSGLNVGHILEGKPIQTPINNATSQIDDVVVETARSPASHDGNECNDNSKESKPPYSYAALIIMAMKSTNSCKMTLSEIYRWISDTFIYYKNIEPAWQNSIRHNLSLNKCFKKIPRPKGDPGKGGYWSIVPELAEKLLENSIRKRRSSVYDGVGGKRMRADVMVKNQLCGKNYIHPATNDTNNKDHNEITIDNNNQNTKQNNISSEENKHDLEIAQNMNNIENQNEKIAWRNIQLNEDDNKSKNECDVAHPEEHSISNTKTERERIKILTTLKNRTIDELNHRLKKEEEPSSIITTAPKEQFLRSTPTSLSSSSPSVLSSASINMLTRLEQHCSVEHAYGKCPVVSYDVTDEENIRAIATELEETSSNAAVVSHATCNYLDGESDSSSIELPVASVAMRSDCIWSSDDSCDLVENMTEELLEAQSAASDCSGPDLLQTSGSDLLQTLHNALETCEGALTASMFVVGDGHFAGELNGMGEAGRGVGHMAGFSGGDLKYLQGGGEDKDDLLEICRRNGSVLEVKEESPETLKDHGTLPEKHE